jgi:hypothetical protein
MSRADAGALFVGPEVCSLHGHSIKHIVLWHTVYVLHSATPLDRLTDDEVTTWHY